MYGVTPTHVHCIFMHLHVHVVHTNLTTYPPIIDSQNLPTLSLQLFPLTSCTQSISLVCSNILKYHGTMSKNTTLSGLTGSRLLISVTNPPLSRPDPNNVQITYNSFILLKAIDNFNNRESSLFNMYIEVNANIHSNV